MKSCPKCKGRATKIIHANDDTIECQQCGNVYPIPNPFLQPSKEELRRRRQARSFYNESLSTP